MRVLVVFAHPRRDSLNGAVLDVTVSELERLGHTVEVTDLYREGFDPVMTAGETRRPSSAIPESIRLEQDRLRRAEALAFVYPVWWYGQPAILKGWLDRVLQEGFALEIHPDGSITGLLEHRIALVVCTAGNPEKLLEKGGFGEAMERQMAIGTLAGCGVGTTRQLILPEVENVPPEHIEHQLERVRRVVRDLFAAD